MSRRSSRRASDIGLSRTETCDGFFMDLEFDLGAGSSWMGQDTPLTRSRRASLVSRCSSAESMFGKTVSTLFGSEPSSRRGSLKPPIKSESRVSSAASRTASAVSRTASTESCRAMRTASSGTPRDVSTPRTISAQSLTPRTISALVREDSPDAQPSKPPGKEERRRSSVRFEDKFAELCDAATPRSLLPTPCSHGPTPRAAGSGTVCADGFAIPTPKVGGATPSSASSTGSGSSRPRRQSSYRIENWGREPAPAEAEPAPTESVAKPVEPDPPQAPPVQPAVSVSQPVLQDFAANVQSPPLLPAAQVQSAPHPLAQESMPPMEASQHDSDPFAPLAAAAAAAVAAGAAESVETRAGAKSAEPRAGAKRKGKTERAEVPKKQDKEGPGKGRCRKNSKPLYWTGEDHEKFLKGLEKFGMQEHLGAGGAELMSLWMGNRSVLQIKSHAQKYFGDLAAGKA